MKLAVVGSRSFKYNFKARIEALYLICDRIEKHKITHLVSGGAAGPDQWGEEAAGNYHLSQTIYKPDWETYGKSAGFRRNYDIINEANYVLIFWDKTSKGTEHDIKLSRKQNKAYEIFIWDNIWRLYESNIA